MKKILFASVFFFSLSVNAQDTTKIFNYPIQARALELLSPGMMADASGQFDDLLERAKVQFRTGARPTGTTIVTIDTVETLVAVALYQMALRSTFYASAINWLKTTNATPRASNAFFARRLDGLDAALSESDSRLRQEGRRRLLGKY